MNAFPPTATLAPQKQRYEIHVNGIVQGVGFRPFIYRLAQKHQVCGYVKNTAAGVQIEVEGKAAELDAFLHEIQNSPPPQAVISSLESSCIPPVYDADFIILSSDRHGQVHTQISPDTATCVDCLRELHDPTDRRYRYPFINCTNCGPRYTIIENIPYDRSTTSMRHFEMCPDCQTEYTDPGGRRFHTQPNCCPVCGPQLSLLDRHGKQTAAQLSAVEETIRLLSEGSIVAIKGLGGFHLAADATNDEALKILRQRKGRAQKPFAIMCANLPTASRYCRLDREEQELLQSSRSPILLALKNKDTELSELIAPGNDRLGVMLPYTPLHHLLFDGRLHALVMTSGNYSEEPICTKTYEALARLAEIADYFLTHNRAIYLGNDDSVVICLAGEQRLVRRSRGFAPQPINFHQPGSTVLAVGGELKNTICLLKDNQAILSQHLGDLKNLEAYAAFGKSADHLPKLFEAEPQLIVHDLHPNYLSSSWAAEQSGQALLAVQHHHAHLASCLAENGAEGPAIGLIMDGAGYGSDGMIWGGEVLIGDYLNCRRYACFEPMPLPGGDAAVAAPWRTAIGYLAAAFDQQLPELDLFSDHDLAPILEMVAKGLNTPWTSSCGRLFDAVAVLAGGRQQINYEAQAAIEFMQAAGGKFDAPYPCEIETSRDLNRLSIQPIIRAVVADRQAGKPISVISRRFHQTLVDLLTKAALLACDETGINTVALSGGVFQNQLLFEKLLVSLNNKKFTVLTHSQVPTNDGCLALGQAAIGRYHLLSSKEVPCA